MPFSIYYLLLFFCIFLTLVACVFFITFPFVLFCDCVLFRLDLHFFSDHVGKVSHQPLSRRSSSNLANKLFCPIWVL